MSGPYLTKDGRLEPGAAADGARGPVVMKFGGSSVANAERLKGVRALSERQRGRGVLLVLSALSGVTDALARAGNLASQGELAAARAELEALAARHRSLAAELLAEAGRERELAALNARLEAEFISLSALIEGAALLRALPERSRDRLMGTGELLSTAVYAAYAGVPWLDARLALRTDGRHGKARPDQASTAELAKAIVAPLVGPGQIAVTQGYIGSDAEGHMTTLGRGGSDYSASILGAAISAAEIQIWTDVEGVLSGDPRVVRGAEPVEVLGYDEAAELAAFGAKVLHPATILPAVERGIPVTVRNSMAPDGRLTTIAHGSGSGREVTALASRGPVSVVTVRTPRMLGGIGFLSRIFDAFGRRGLSVDLVATSEVSVSASVDEGAELDGLCAELASFAEVQVLRDRALVAVVGERLANAPGVAGRAFSALGDINVELISMGAGAINLSFVVRKEDAAEAQRRLHAAFFPGLELGREAS